MKPIRCLAAFLAAWVLWSAALMGVGAKGGADEPVSTSSAPAASMPGVDLKLVRDKAFRHLLAGEFGRGLVLLESPAGKMAGAAAAEARTLTAQYLESLAQADAERQSELSRARKRVRLARLAEDYRPKLMEAGLDEKLYEALEAVADAVQAANGVLEVRPTTQPADMRKTVAEHIERAREQLLAVRELLGDGHDRWGQAFRDGADQLDRALSAYPDAWARATLPGIGEC